jgi:glycosyltransferase involved in cell wall biosynthesis
MMLAPGASPHARRPLGWLLRRGVEIVFVDARDPLPARRAGYRFIPFPRTGLRPLRGAFGSRAGHALALWPALPLHLVWRAARPDLVHVHYVDHRARQAVRAGARPLVLSAWGTDIHRHFQPGADPEDRRAIGEALASADLVIADAPDVAARCAELAGRELATERVPLGVDTERFRPDDGTAARTWRRALDIPAGAAVILSARAMAPLYRHDAVLEAFARAWPHLCRPAVLVFKVWSPGGRAPALACAGALRRRAHARGVAGAVRWIDPVPEEQLPGIYALADVVVSFPRTDGLPVTFFEAAACERPVIACRLPAYAASFAERLFHMVDADDIDDLAAAMARTVNDPGGSTARVAEARRVVTAEYDEATTIDKLLDAYRRLLGHGNPTPHPPPRSGEGEPEGPLRLPSPPRGGVGGGVSGGLY